MPSRIRVLAAISLSAIASPPAGAEDVVGLVGSPSGPTDTALPWRRVPWTVEAEVGVDAPVINLSKRLDGLGRNVGPEAETRALRCSVHGDSQATAVLVVGGARPSGFRHRRGRANWEDCWGSGRAALVVVGASEGMTLRGRCESSDVVPAGRPIDWTVTMTGGGVPGSADELTKSGIKLMMDAVGAVEEFGLASSLSSFSLLVDMVERSRRRESRSDLGD